MLSLGSAAFTSDRDLVGTYSVNLTTLPGACAHPDTERWWASHPHAWAACRESPIDPEVAMTAYAQWLDALPGRPVFVAWPVGFDFLFVHWYLSRFTGRDPFGHNALDMRSFAMGLLGTEYGRTGKRQLPTDWFDPLPHTHIALDDALAQGALFCHMLAASRGQSRPPLR